MVPFYIHWICFYPITKIAMNGLITSVIIFSQQLYSFSFCTQYYDEWVRLSVTSSKKCTMLDEQASSLQKSLPLNWGQQLAHEKFQMETCNVIFRKEEKYNFVNKRQSIIICSSLFSGVLAECSKVLTLKQFATLLCCSTTMVNF